jgi:hypothetical protein
MRNELNSMIIKRFQPDYKKASKKEKSNILAQLQHLTQLERKHIIKILSGKRSSSATFQKGRPLIYDRVLGDHIMKLHELMERISPKRMVAAMPLWIGPYEKHCGPLSDELIKQIKKISSSTIGRIIKQRREELRGKSTTRVNHKIKNLIPLKRLDEKVTAPGTVQADTVAHCGTALLGNFANTLTVTDIFTGWT